MCQEAQPPTPMVTFGLVVEIWLVVWAPDGHSRVEPLWVRSEETVLCPHIWPF